MTDPDGRDHPPSPWKAPKAGCATVPGAPDPSHDPSRDPRLHGAYSGTRGALFQLALKTALLTAITLGIYRFWERTRLRRHIWSATAPGGDAFEYTGTGKEKFLGFLIALVVLGVGLGLVQLGLFFFNLSVFAPAETPEGGIVQMVLFQASFLILLPLYFFAMYRAYRYRMARTRWRGIRFGVLPGAWGYAWRHLVYLLLTLCSLGVLWPLMTFRLEAYRANRTFFGDARWHQGGRWTMLYPAMKHLGIGVAWLGLSVVLLASGYPGWAMMCILIGNVWGCCGYVHYRVRSFAILTAHKVIGDGIRLGADPTTREVLGIVIGGGVLAGVCGAVFSGVVVGILTATGVVGALSNPELAMRGLDLTGQILSVFLTLISLQIYGVFALIFILQPIYAHVIAHTWVENPIRLTSVKQRAADDFADADGFADALDVGGAF